MVRSRREATVSIVHIKSPLIGKKYSLKNRNYKFTKKISNARHSSFSSQNLVKSRLSSAAKCHLLWQYCPQTKNINKTRNTKEILKILLNLKPIFSQNYLSKYIGNIKNPNPHPWCPFSSIFQYKPVEEHDESYKLTRSGDVESNPGPAYNGATSGCGKMSNPDKDRKKKHPVEIITYNCRGLKDYKKLKRILNTCANVIGKNKLSLLMLQETHLEAESVRKLTLMWRGNFSLSPGLGGSRGCLTLFDKCWEIEDKYESQDGRLVCLALKSEQLSVIVINAYAPNDHSLEFFENMFEKLIHFKDRFPLHEVVVAGDLNLVIDPETDSVNRVASVRENISSVLVRDNLTIMEISDSYREKLKKGGYTWNRGNIYSRLDYVFCSKLFIASISSAKVDWTFDKSDHAAVRILVDLPVLNLKGPGLVRVNADILKIQHVKTEFRNRLIESISEIPEHWDPNQKLEFIKIVIRSSLSEISGKQKKIEEIEYNSTCDQLNRLKNNYADCLERGINVPNIINTINELQKEIDLYQDQKSQKLAELAKCKWFNEGEKSNKYFLNLLKRRNNETTMNLLSDGETTASTQEDIENLVMKFYSKLYNIDETVNDDYNSFFPVLPQLSEADRCMLDSPITLDEMWETLKDTNESSPGPDGIPYLVYKECWEVLGQFILKSWQFSKEKGILPEFNRLSTIKLIPKEGKDPGQIGNWRPITLSNCDLKIITKLLSNRVAKILPKIILETQVAYIPGRAVHDNLRMSNSSICTAKKITLMLS